VIDSKERAMQNEPAPADAVVYRPSKPMSQILAGVAVLEAVSATVALVIFGVQGEFVAGLPLAAGFGFFALATGGLALGYVRHRLLLTPEIVRSVGIFATREMRLGDVTRVEWKRYGAVVLHEDRRRLKIDVGKYEARDQTDLVRRLRTALEGRHQEGWERYESRCLPCTFDWTPSEARFRSGGVEYRLPAAMIAIPITFAVFPVAIGIVGICGFLFPDRSVKNPVAFLAYAWTISVGGLAVCAWMVRTYLRHRLTLAPKFVRSVNTFGSQEVRLANVERVVWGRGLAGYRVVLHAGAARLPITFTNYDGHDRTEMIHLLHMIAAGRTEEGWGDFGPRRWLQPVDPAEARAQARHTLRFVLIAWGIALPFIYAVLVCEQLVAERPRLGWFLVAIVPIAFASIIIVPIWLFVRSVPADPEKGPKAD
jgi:hypothetical protein